MAEVFKGLVDLSGRPIPKRLLTIEQAGPTLHGVRQPYGGHPAAGLTPGRLGRLLRDSIEWDPERYLELAEDMEERDLHYAAVLSVRKRQVAGLDIDVVAAGDDAEAVRDAELVREVIGRDEFQDELVDILDAIGKGFSASEIVWETSAGQWMPSAIKFRDPRHFQFDRTDPERIMLRGDSGLEDLKPFCWIVHRAKVKSGLTIRGGIARAVAWTFLFKSFTLKDWAIFVEAYGHPLRLGKYGPDASEVDKDVLLQAVSNIGSDFAAIVPNSMEITFEKADIAGSHELYEKRADWLDRQISKVVLGQTATTDAIAGGHAVGRVHDRVRDDIEKSDARQLAATLTRDLVQPLITLNFGPRKSYPRITIGRPAEEDTDKLIANIAKLVPLGLEVGMSTVRDRLNLPEPGPRDKLLRAPADERPPPPPPAPKTAFGARPTRDDAIAEAIDELLSEGGWEQLVSPLASSIGDRLRAAATPEEARAALAEMLAGMDMAAFTDKLAQAMFAARLAGELDEDI